MCCLPLGFEAKPPGQFVEACLTPTSRFLVFSPPPPPARIVTTGISGVCRCGGSALRSDWGGWQVHRCPAACRQREPSLPGGSKFGHVGQRAGYPDSSCCCELLCSYQVPATAAVFWREALCGWMLFLGGVVVRLYTGFLVAALGQQQASPLMLRGTRAQLSLLCWDSSPALMGCDGVPLNSLFQWPVADSSCPCSASGAGTSSLAW